MVKIKIGSINHQNIVKGDHNLLKQGEILVSNAEGYTILRKRVSGGKIKTFVVIPLEDFENGEDIVANETIPERVILGDKKETTEEFIYDNSKNIEGD